MAVGTGVSATRAAANPTGVVDTVALVRGEPIVHLGRSPGTVTVELKDIDSLFDRASPTTYPHAGPMLNGSVAKFLVDTAREDRRSPEIGITITLHSPPLPTEEEAGDRAQMSNFFTNEAEMAALGKRVNSTEAWGSLRYALPVVAIAAIVAAWLTLPSKFGVPTYVTELAYLVVVIWVMVWDPIEKLVFDSYFIRLRIRALHKLAAATIVFAYRSGHSTPVEPAPSDRTPMETIKNLLDG